jgi:hypothetical protein
MFQILWFLSGFRKIIRSSYQNQNLRILSHIKIKAEIFLRNQNGRRLLLNLILVLNNVNKLLIIDGGIFIV